jgi:hypothetical protein
MSVSFVSKKTFQSASAATSYATTSHTPAANKLQIASVTSRTGSGTPNQPTLSGNGLTWVAINTTVYDDAGSQKRVTAFRALGASPSAGALTADFAAQSQSDCIITIDEATGMDITGTNGSGAIVQSVVNQEKTGAATTLIATLAAFASTRNGTFGVVAIGNGSGTSTAGSGFAKVSEDATAANLRLMTEFRNDNDTTVDFNSSVAGELGVIAVEIKCAIPQMSTLTDSFNDNTLDTSVFGSFGTTVAETNQELEFQMAIAYANYLGVFTINRYNLTGDACIVKLVSAGNQALTSNQALFQLELDTNNQLYFLVETNLLKAVKKVAGSVTDVTGSIAYSATNHKYLRISESGGTITWSYSSDGKTWTTFTTLANPFAVTELQVNLLAGTYASEASASTVIFDELNMVTQPKFFSMFN